MSNILTNERIPNNVGLSDDKRLQRALEAWQPSFINWWKEMGPMGFQEDNVFLRTAISVESDGWANFDYVKMPDYRWGIFLADAVPNRTIGFGDCFGDPVWQQGRQVRAGGLQFGVGVFGAQPDAQIQPVRRLDRTGQLEVRRGQAGVQGIVARPGIALVSGREIIGRGQ